MKPDRCAWSAWVRSVMAAVESEIPSDPNTLRNIENRAAPSLRYFDGRVR